MTTNYDALRTNLNGLAEVCRDIAVEHGLWGDGRSFPEVIAWIHSEVSETLEAWCEAKGEPFAEAYSYRFSNTMYTIRSGEILVGRKIVQGPAGGFDSWVEDDWRPLTPELAKELGGEVKPIGVPSEMADILIRVLDACASYGIDIERAVREKIAYNKAHGGKRT